MNIGFDNELYIKKQTEHIKERMRKFGNKLYLEFGGNSLTITTPQEFFPVLM